ncbi:unnamed protein product [Adineta steineri]|uniref:Zinc finger protein n=4 Tax=Adineta steineri TaxID=433720 RepID=A0A815C1H8_9BILA|nr:unnamed protein product [Adineta steineri]
MAKAIINRPRSELKSLTDCMYFINGKCKLNDTCHYRHCQAAAAQTNNCFRWPKLCKDSNCPYRHPAPPSSKTIDKKKRIMSEPSIANLLQPTPQPSQLQQEGLISFFWDIENVPIPKAQKPFDIVQRIRQKLVVEAGLREYSFSCFCNSTTISQDNQLSLFHGNVRIIHVPDRKPGAVDRQIMLELDRFERAHRPPATIVLISGDIDFVGKLSDLRHQARFHVIVIHNKPAKAELKQTVNAHYAWETFTDPPSLMTEAIIHNKPVNAHNAGWEAFANPPSLMTEAISSNSLVNELTRRPPQSYRMNNQNNNGNLRRVDPSPNRSSPSAKSRPTTAKKQLHKCPKCPDEFGSIQALRQHQDAKDHLFECPICDETFTTLDGITQHQKAKGHYEAEYQCEQCTRRFTKLDGLNQHQRATSHNGLKMQTSSVTNGSIWDETPPLIVPQRNMSMPNTMQGTPMSIILQGIEALVQHYPKQK